MENQNTYCVYMHINKINNKVYVGMTKYGNNPNKRWKNGKAYLKYELFWPDIQKYGWDNFHHLIMQNNLSYEEAREKERQYILATESNKEEYGYNVRIGYEIPESTRIKMSESRKGENHRLYRKELPEEIKRKISETKKGKYKGENNPNAKKCVIIYDNIKYETLCRNDMEKLFKDKLNISIAKWFNAKLIPKKHINNIQLIQKDCNIIYKAE